MIHPELDLVLALHSTLAYLDPGTGSFAFQILLATLFGGMFALKQSWAGIKARFVSRIGEATGSDHPA